jgi:hypothetical protein
MHSREVNTGSSYSSVPVHPESDLASDQIVLKQFGFVPGRAAEDVLQKHFSQPGVSPILASLSVAFVVVRFY